MAIRTAENSRPKTANRGLMALLTAATLAVLLLAGVGYLAVCPHPVYVGPYVLLGPRCDTSVTMRNVRTTMSGRPGQIWQWHAASLIVRSPGSPGWDPRMKVSRTWIFGRFAIMRPSDK